MSDQDVYDDIIEMAHEADDLEERAETAEAEAAQLRAALSDISTGQAWENVSIDEEPLIFRYYCWQACIERANQALSGQSSELAKAKQAVVDAAMTWHKKGESILLIYEACKALANLRAKEGSDGV